DTLHTLIQPSDPAFEYHIGIPADEPPGLYWYHPHPHGFSEAQVLGGASGALIVEGMEREKPQVAGLPERVLILRDQLVPGLPDSDEDAGVGKDISLNFVPVTYPLYRPARMRVRPGEREFWRVLNAASDTFFDLQLRFGKVNQQVQNPQPLEIIALDGVPAGPNTTQTHVLLSPGARAEFIVTTPPTGAFAELVALKYDTGPDGAPIPYHVIANIIGSQDAPPTATTMPQLPALPAPWHFTGLTNLVPVRARKLYFSEVQQNPKYPEQPATYFITLDGATPKAFDMNFKKPDITVRQGTVEDWVLENRAREAHTFHIHQLHFQLLERDGHKVNEPAVRDTIDVPYWDGKSPSYPSVKIRMDFRAAQILGTFVYHCHILEHEDGGMMGAIRVVPAERSLRNDLNLPQLR
ncbi:MAG TPA: multicopper oxidase domain-containing protein, partial [Bryobacteraceae bacterium]|nr:multicopper oxidase domain-containing protein [Bryobacteraceae bacterium]